MCVEYYFMNSFLHIIYIMRSESLHLLIIIMHLFKVSKAVLAINLLIGKKNVRTDQVSQAALLSIPEFATVDLFSSYTDYLLGMLSVYEF